MVTPIIVRLTALASSLWLIGAAPPATTDLKQIREMQSFSFYGPIERWDESIANMPNMLQSEEIQNMRDKAYLFCSKLNRNLSDCYQDEDRALFSTVSALSAFEFYVKSDIRSESGRPFSIKINPHLFLEAKRRCWEIYTDHGGDDARILGPCLAAAIGNDYFSTGPVY